MSQMQTGIFALIALFWCYRLYRQSKITETYALHKTTDDGESVTTQFSFTADMSSEEKMKKLNEVFVVSEYRKEFCDARFKEHLAKERAKQEADRTLKSV